MILKKDLNLELQVHKILKSHPVLALETIFGVLAFTYRELSFSIYPLVFVMIINFLFCRDLTPSFAPFVIISMTIICYYGAEVVDFIAYTPLIALFLGSIAAHFVLFPPKKVKGKLFFSMLAVSVAIIFSGITVITASEYFSGTSIFYTLSLGPLMILVYFILLNSTVKDKNHNPSETLARSMCYIGLACAVTVLIQILPPLLEKEIWYFQWKNNMSVIMLTTIPFPFYLAVKSKKLFASCLEFSLGCFLAFSCFITLSRGGMLFSLITLGLCLIYVTVCAKNIAKRFLFTVIFAFFVIILTFYIISAEWFWERISDTAVIREGEARVGLMQLAFENFLKYPIFGRGMSYNGAGAETIYKPVNGTAMFWYHSTPLQVIGSMGIVGVLAYAFQYISRVYVIFKKPKAGGDKKPDRTFDFCIFLAYLAFSMMACVNPGDFNPVPHGITVLFLIVVGETENKFKKIDLKK